MNSPPDFGRIVACHVHPVARIGKVEGEKPFVEYRACLTCTRGLFSFWFRYSALQEVDTRLRKRWKKREEVPDFPGRGFFRSVTDPDFIEERRRELSAWLGVVVPLLASRDEDVDAFVNQAEPRADFFLPRKELPLPAVLMVRDEEIWIGTLLESTGGSLNYLVMLRDHLARLRTIEEQLGALDLNRPKLQAATEAIRSALPTLQEVLEEQEALTQVIPPLGFIHLCEMAGAGRIAVQWGDNVEQSILVSLDRPGYIHVQPEAVPEETPGEPLPSPPHSDEEALDNEPPAEAHTLEGMEQAADALLVEMLGSGEASKQHKEALLGRRKRLLEEAARARERASSGAARERWRELMDFIERHVVFSPSLHDTVLRLEQQLYQLVDARANLSKDSSPSAVAQVRKDVIGLRRVLRQVKEETLKKQVDSSDPALAADLNALTDLQENASHIQLDLESNFEYETTMEDMVAERLRQKVLDDAEREHEAAEDSLFEL